MALLPYLQYLISHNKRDKKWIRMQITEVSEYSLKTLSTRAFILEAQLQSLLYLNLFIKNIL